MATLPSPTTKPNSKTLTLNTSSLFVQSYNTLSSQSPQPLPSLSDRSLLPPLSPDLPHSKLIPKTRFIIDGFRHAGPHSVSYFLSHFHSDHYTGLNPNWSKGLIFCSELTSRLLIDSLKVSPLFIVSLPLRERIIIDGCEVTLVDANHCPGAVQFLFKVPGVQSKDERYVHTGDFRFSNSMKLDPLLYEFVGADAIFLDTTYCNPKFVFPSQVDSVNYVVDTVERIRRGNEKVLFIIATYVVGKEKILLEISKRCGCMIHVDSRKMSILRTLGFGESEVFTEDALVTDVHVVGWNVLGETWPYFRPNFTKMKEMMVEKGYEKAVGIVPTGWMYEAKKDGFAVRSKGSLEIHLVPYSEHSSYEELREYVRFLRPKRVIPTVGMDVEKLDSKHAITMRKHFAGLVDEMANKQEFLMGFHRKSQSMDVKGADDASIDVTEEFDKKDELNSVENMPETHNKTALGIFPENTFSLQEPLSNSDVPKNEDKEEMIQQLCDCLPKWVTRDQKLDLLTRSHGDIVEAVSDFYERETEFHQQIAACTKSDGISAINLNSDSSLVPELASNKAPLHGRVTTTSSQDKRSTILKHSVKSKTSPKKRSAGPEKVPNKRGKSNLKSESSGSKQSLISKFLGGKSNSTLESSGPKQSTITKFFSKLVHNTSQAGEIDSATATTGEHPEDGNTQVLNGASEPYTEQLDKFLQVLNNVSRNDATSILEKAKGDLNVALDIYYSTLGAKFDGEGDLSCGTRSVENVCSPAIELKLSDERIVSRSNLLSPGIAVNNSNATLMLLPLEKYSPSEHACWKSGQPAPYLHIARTFDMVEGERGKIKATSMLCNMFRSLLALSPKDVLPAVYLCTNKIAPDHKNMELNIGGSMITAAIEEACGTNKITLREMYNNLGDLGDVAQVCRQKQTLLAPHCALTIQEVFSALRKISSETGSGSTTRKKNLIVNLMRSCREKEIKFLVRTLVRNLRIGAMMRTVLPALAQAVLIHSCPEYLQEGSLDILKDKLQSISAAVIEAYNMLPDLDLLVPALLNKGIEFSSSTLSMIPGVPIKPMLARISNGTSQALKLFQGRAFTCEFKYDGQRAQIHRLDDGSLRVYSRNGDETTTRFPDLLNIIEDRCNPTAVSFIVDAEVVAVDRKNGCKLMSFQELSSRDRGSKNSLIALNNIKIDICVFIFDIMFANGEGLLGFPLRQRRRYFKDLFHEEKLGYFEYAKEITVEAEDACLGSQETLTRINSFLEDAFRSSCEGIMVKSLDVDAGYAASKRTDAWLKVKRDYLEGMNDSLDLVPIGAWHGNGRKAGWYSPYLMACYNPDTEEFQSVCRVMSGFSDSFYKEMKEFFCGERILSRKPPYYQTAEVPDHWFSPELVWEIRGADFTVSPVHHAAIGLVHPSRGISIRFPRFIRTLSDRKAEDCSTAGDLADIFQLQTRKMDVRIQA